MAIFFFPVAFGPHAGRRIESRSSSALLFVCSGLLVLVCLMLACLFRGTNSLSSLRIHVVSCSQCFYLALSLLRFVLYQVLQYSSLLVFIYVLLSFSLFHVSVFQCIPGTLDVVCCCVYIALVVSSTWYVGMPFHCQIPLLHSRCIMFLSLFETTELISLG